MIFAKDRANKEKFETLFDCRQCKYRERTNGFELTRGAWYFICGLSNKHLERYDRVPWDLENFIEDFCELKIKDEAYFLKIGKYMTRSEISEIYKKRVGYDE